MIQWEEGKCYGSDLAHSGFSKQPSGLKEPHLSWLCSALLTYLYWLGGKCMFRGVEYQRQGRSKPDATKMKPSKWPTAGVPRRLSLPRTFYYDRSQTSQEVEERRKSKERHLRDQRGGANLSHRMVALCDGMDSECVAGIRQQWWRWRASPSRLLTLSPAAN